VTVTDKRNMIFCSVTCQGPSPPVVELFFHSEKRFSIIWQADFFTASSTLLTLKIFPHTTHQINPLFIFIHNAKLRSAAAFCRVHLKRFVSRVSFNNRPFDSLDSKKHTLNPVIYSNKKHQDNNTEVGR